MYKWAAIAVLGTLAILAYQHFDEKREQQQLLEQANRVHQQDKAALDAARATEELAPLEQFIFDRPDSPWLDTAIYYRDRLILQKAVDSRDVRQLNRYIKNHPDSQWLNTARQHIKRLQRERENREIQQRIQAENVPDYLTRPAAKKTTRTVSEPTAKPVSQARSQPSSQEAPVDPNERIKRALSIYQKINKQQQRERDQARTQREQQEKLLAQCNRLQDRLKQFKPRTRWYELDENGNRVFIDKQTVQQRKQAMQQDYDRHCRG